MLQIVLFLLLVIQYGESVGMGEFVASKCDKNERNQVIGCVAQSLIPSNLTFWVEFKDAETSNFATICLQTCAKIYQNTSLALVFGGVDSNDSSLDCYCAMAEALTEAFIGPEIFCNAKCSASGSEAIPCGGQHLFSNGDFENFYSIYCLNGMSSGGNVTLPPTIPTILTTSPSTTSTSTTTTFTSFTTTKSGEDPDGVNNGTILDEILNTVVEANMRGFAMIGLLILLIILVIVIVAWLVIFVEAYEPGPNSIFYRQKSEHKKPILPTDIKSLPDSYGTTNQAFDAEPEVEETHGQMVTSQAPEVTSLASTASIGGLRTPHISQSVDSSFDANDSDGSEDSTPRSESVRRAGLSTFYGDSNEPQEHNNNQNHDNQNHQ